MFVGFVMVFYIMVGWWCDVVRELCIGDYILVV